jgi:hypothetical protein
VPRENCLPVQALGSEQRDDRTGVFFTLLSRQVGQQPVGKGNVGIDGGEGVAVLVRVNSSNSEVCSPHFAVLDNAIRAVCSWL